MSNISLLILPAALLLMTVACTFSGENRERLDFREQGREVPAFNADSAFHYIERQVGFGPRNPGSEGHEKAGKYLVETLQKQAGVRGVYRQEFTAEGYGGDTLNLSNIIAAFNTESSDRIMLCAHWDTRPRADKDSVRSGEPILGADDGGSGTALLLELARLFSKHPPPVGVDIILFDGEDYGRANDPDRYFLGSRYWSEHPPVANYSPRFGILLDMVGGANARFPKEGYSLQYAPALVDEIWEIAAEKGFEGIFIDRRGRRISDDHVIVNRNLNIPTIDIIRHDAAAGEEVDEVRFAPYWHTHDDNMEIISRETLNAVGVVIAELIYNRVGNR